MQYATPQFIEEEGKIVFFLTYRQFFILVGGGGVLVVLYMILPIYVFFFAALVVAGLTLVIAFLRINNRSIVMFFLTFLGFTLRAKTYTWKKKESMSPMGHTQKSAETYAEKRGMQQTSETPAKPSLNMQTSKLRDIQKTIDTKR